MTYTTMTAAEKAAELAKLTEEYRHCKEKGLSLDMSRGKPAKNQLDLSEGLLTALKTSADCFSEDGSDCRNYGVPDGVPEMKKIFADLLDIPASNIYLAGASSLQLMYDAVGRCMLFGAGEGMTPWSRFRAEDGSAKPVKFLCPAPGYDRHFGLCQCYGIEMIPVEMTPTGPNMDEVERLVQDPAVKGIWCVPKYSNPTGVTFSNDTVRRLAAMDCAAGDFRIFWDNAYAIHDLYEETEPLLNLFEEAKKAGNEDRVYIFASFSKITFSGGSVAIFASSDRNLAYARKAFRKQSICYDKVNQLRHARYFGSAEGVRAHMKKHAAILRPKFEAVEEIFERELGACGIGSWTKPRGGYFISLDLPDGTAKRTYDLCKAAGVTLTAVGETFPYGIDPRDRNLRIAPSFPTVAELTSAAEVLCLCAKIAYLEK